MTKKIQLKPRKIPVQERSRFTVAAIYQAAAQVLYMNGYEGTTTDLIAEKAGVSIGTLYQYFSSKESIIYGMFEQHMKELTSAMNQIQVEICKMTSVDPDITQRIIRMVFEHNIHDMAQHSIFIGNIGWPEEIVCKQMEMGRTLKKILEQILFSSPNIRVNDYKTAAHILWSTVRLTIHDYLLYWTDEVQSEALIKELSMMINQYIFRRPPDSSY